MRDDLCSPSSGGPMNAKIGDILQDGQFTVSYERWCPGSHDFDTGECVVLRSLDGHVAHWHLGRFWFRKPRSVAECVVQALYRIQALRLHAAREATELAGAKDFAQQLITDGLLHD